VNLRTFAPFPASWSAPHRQSRQIPLQLHIASRDLLLMKIIGVHHLLQFEQDVLAPIPFQAMGDLCLASLDPSIPQLRICSGGWKEFRSSP
jgi:hypothetical protein